MVSKDIRIGFDFHNLSTAPDRVIRTGIQTLAFELLKVLSRKSATYRERGFELVPLPVLPAGLRSGSRFGDACSTQLNNSKLVLDETAKELGLPEGRIWEGFVRQDEGQLPGDLEKRFFEVGATLDWLIVIGLTEFRPAVERLREVNPNLKVAAVVHDLIPLILPDTTSETMPLWFNSSVKGSILGCTDHVFANSRHTAIDVYHLLQDVVPRNVPITYATLPPETLPEEELSDADAKLLLRELGLEEQNYFVSLGTLEPRKNLANALIAFQKFIDLHPDRSNTTKYLMIGKEGWNSEYQRVKNQVGSAMDRIVFGGYMSSPQMLGLMKRAIALVMPSRYEGFGLPVALSRRLGLRVVTSVTTSLPEAADTRAIFVDPTQTDGLAAGLLEAEYRLRNGGNEFSRRSSLGHCENWDDLLDCWLKALDGRQSSEAIHKAGLSSGRNEPGVATVKTFGRRKRKIIIDVHNLSIHPTLLQKTGIQEVTHSMLLACARLRKDLDRNIELLCLPDFVEGGFGYHYAPAIRCEPRLFQKVERDSGLESADLWGYDFKALGYRFDLNSFRKVFDSADWMVVTSQFDVRRIMRTVGRSAPDLQYAHVFHDLIPCLLPDLVVGPLSRWFPEDYLHSIGKTSSLALGNSRNSAIDLMRWLDQHGYQQVGIQAVPFPLRHGPLVHGDGKLAASLGCKTKKYLLLIGSTDPRKNTARSIRGFKRAIELDPGIRDEVSLLIVGPHVWRTPDIYAAKEEAEAVGARVFETGYLSDEALRMLVAGCSGVMMPSRYEGFGLPIAIAQAFGKPVITAANSSLPEVCLGHAYLSDPWSDDSLSMAVLSCLRDESGSESRDPRHEMLLAKSWEDYLSEVIELTLQQPARIAPRESEFPRTASGFSHSEETGILSPPPFARETLVSSAL